VKDVISKSRETIWYGSVLVLLCASAVLAGDPNNGSERPRTRTKAERLERVMHPEVALARAILRKGREPLEVRRRAETIVRKWDNDVLDPEPVLLEASLVSREFSRARGELLLVGLDEDKDLLGLRIREKYILPNGVESFLEEDYPVYAEYKGIGLGLKRLGVCYRTGIQIKDEQQWQTYLNVIQRASEPTRPPVWMSVPDPNRVEVFVSIYDRAGHESEWIPVEGPSGMDEIPAKETLAFAEYEKHGMEVARWPEGAIDGRPDNAALLYYRAAACLAKADPCTAMTMNLMSQGREPDDRVRAHLGRCLKGIQLAHLAAQIPECDWGLAHDPVERHTVETITSLRRVSFTLAYHAETLAADGHYRVAFENCLVNRRLAHHIGDDTYMLYLVSRSVGANAIFPLLRILSDMPADAETLTWLCEQLATVDGAPARPAVTLERWYDLEIRKWDPYRGDRPFDRAWVLAQIKDEEDRQEAMALTDEQLLVRFLSEQWNEYRRPYGLAVPDGLLVRARAGYGAFIDSAVGIMESDASYEQKQAQLDEIERQFYGRVKRHEPVALLRRQDIDVQKYHEFLVCDATFFNNLLKVAVEVLLVAAQTGEAPEMLPEGLPKDGFTGEEFTYERTETGFILGMDPENLSGLRKREYTFVMGRR
jgi:hypothetical protein